MHAVSTASILAGVQISSSGDSLPPEGRTPGQCHHPQESRGAHLGVQAAVCRAQRLPVHLTRHRWAVSSPSQPEENGIMILLLLPTGVTWILEEKLGISFPYEPQPPTATWAELGPAAVWRARCISVPNEVPPSASPAANGRECEVNWG